MQVSQIKEAFKKSGIKKNDSIIVHGDAGIAEQIKINKKDKVNFFQWRTIKELDGAFNSLDHDPQIIDVQGSYVTRLPKVYNGRRLGHNWSLSWVAEEITK